MSNGQSKSGTEGMYNSITQLVINSESISWSRFYYYLVAVSLLIVAWVGLFTAESRSITCQFLSIFIPPIGVLISVLWRGLEERSRAFLNLYLDLGFKFEIGDDDYKQFEKLRQDEKTQDSSLYNYLKKLTGKSESILPFTQTEMKIIELKKERATWRFYTSTWIFKAVTGAFIALFCLLGTASIYSLIFLLIMHVKNTQFLRCIFTHFCH